MRLIDVFNSLWTTMEVYGTEDPYMKGLCNISILYYYRDMRLDIVSDMIHELFHYLPFHT